VFQPLVSLPLLPPGNDPFRPAFSDGIASLDLGRFQAGDPGTRQDLEGFEQANSRDHREEPGTSDHDQRSPKIKNQGFLGRRKKTGQGHSSRRFPQTQVKSCRAKGTEAQRHKVAPLDGFFSTLCLCAFVTLFLSFFAPARNRSLEAYPAASFLFLSSETICGMATPALCSMKISVTV